MKKISLMFIFIIFIIFCMLNCSKEITSNNPIPTYEETGIIDEDGGIVQVTDTESNLYGCIINIPEGAINGEVEISINEVTSIESLQVAMIDTSAVIVDFQPSGYQFSLPVEIGIPYTENTDIETMQIYTFDEELEMWTSLPIDHIDTQNMIAFTKITHFSWYVTGYYADFYNIEIYKVDSNRLALRIQTPTLENIKPNLITIISTGCLNLQQLLEYVDIDNFFAWYKINIYEDTWLFPEQYQFDWHYYSGSAGLPLMFNPMIFRKDIGLLWENGQANFAFNDPETHQFFRGDAYIFISDPLPTNQDYKIKVDHLYSSVSDPATAYNYLDRWTNNFGFTIKDIDFTDLQSLPDSIDYNQNGITNQFDPQVNNEPPNPPSNPIPVNNATNISINTDLSWECSDPENDPLTYDVYFGTSTDPLLVNSGQSNTTFDPGILNDETTYYWKIIAHDNHFNSTIGDIWAFTTEDILLTANFTASDTLTIEDTSVQFTDLSNGNPTDWQWDFDNDGSVDANNQNPIWTYDNPGLYTVSLTVSDGSTSDTITKIDYIDVRVNIPDDNFKAAVNGYLGQPASHNPTIAEMNGIIGYFVANNSNISFIEGAQYLINVNVLELESNQISDISPLSGLINIISLYLGHNQISDISAVSGLMNLTYLTMNCNQISDISPISNLTNLPSLSLAYNQISDISALSGLTNMTWLYLGNNQISDISVISGFTNMISLSFRSNQITDISAVTGFTNLTHLVLLNNNISNISAVSGLENLSELWLQSNQISDISAVSGLTNLTFLDLGQNQISNISAVSDLINLTFLDLDENQISNISALSGLTNLPQLSLRFNQISDISALSGLTNMTWLYLGNNQISDISAISDLSNLLWLNLSYNQISDISALSGLINLTELFLNYNQISNIYSLVQNVGLANGDYLNLISNPLSNISINEYIPILQSRGVNVYW